MFLTDKGGCYSDLNLGQASNTVWGESLWPARVSCHVNHFKKDAESEPQTWLQKTFVILGHGVLKYKELSFKKSLSEKVTPQDL